MALQATPSPLSRIPIRSEKQKKNTVLLAEHHSPLWTFSPWEKNQYSKNNNDSFIKYIYIYPGDLPDPAIKSGSPVLLADSLMSQPLRAWLSVTPWTSQPVEFSRPEYWSGSPIPSPGDLPNQGSNPGLPNCKQILYQLSHQGSLTILQWVAYPFSRGSSQPRTRAGVSRIAGGFFTSWAMREAPWKWTLSV